MPGPSRRQVIGGLAATAALSAGTPPVRGAASEPTLAAGRARALARGVNITDWLTSIGGEAPAAAVLQALRRHGFAALRLPVDPAALAAPDGAVLVEKTALAAADLVRAGFAVLVDMHPGAGLGDAFARHPARAEATVTAAWRRLAPVLAELPAERVFLELLNEPPMTREAWLELRGRLATLLRRACPRHTLVWGAARSQGIWETLEHPPLDDPNQIAAVHYYTPMGFTHQCAGWSDPTLAGLHHLPFPARRIDDRVDAVRRELAGDAAGLARLQREFEADWTIGRIERDFADLAAWSRHHACPVVLDEFGVYNECVDGASRRTWTRAVRRAAETNGIGWLYWELDRGFGFLGDRQRWTGVDASLVAALIH